MGFPVLSLTFLQHLTFLTTRLNIPNNIMICLMMLNFCLTLVCIFQSLVCVYLYLGIYKIYISVSLTAGRSHWLLWILLTLTLRGQTSLKIGVLRSVHQYFLHYYQKDYVTHFISRCFHCKNKNKNKNLQGIKIRSWKYISP